MYGVRFSAAVLATTVLLGNSLLNTSAFAASAEKGKQSYMKFGCWGCHGIQGQGGITGPKLAPEPLPWEGFSAFVRTTNRTMPPYREAVLSNDDLADIHAYLLALPKPADYKTIRLLAD